MAAEAIGAVGAVRVVGLHELDAAFRKMDKDLGKELRDELRVTAEPVRSDAEAFARQAVSHMTLAWSRMRVGITAKTLVYVAPKKRGIKNPADPRKRPPFGDKLMDRAMQPALDQNQQKIQARLDTMLDVLAGENGF